MYQGHAAKRAAQAHTSWFFRDIEASDSESQELATLPPLSGCLLFAS